MRPLPLLACLSLYAATFATAQVSITKSPAGWQFTNVTANRYPDRSGKTCKLISASSDMTLTTNSNPALRRQPIK